MQATRPARPFPPRPLLVVGFLLSIVVGACGEPQAPTGAIPTLTLGPTPSRPPAAPAGAMVTTGPTAAVSPTPAIPTDAQGFADPAFRELWDATDREVAQGRASRGWLWGPKPFATKREPYSRAPGGVRLVQYFDKSRMEINDPHGDRASPWFVTNGLLTSELVAGRVQTGPDTFEDLEPAQVPVAGDLERPDPQTPRYADFANLTSARGDNRAPRQLGAPVTTRLKRGGATEQESGPPVTVRIAAYDDTLGHNIPDVFVDYLQGVAGGWTFVTGYPISEPYWVAARSGGETRLLLVQLFERRALAYTRGTKEGWQVEFADIGLHYYRWRYHNR